MKKIESHECTLYQDYDLTEEYPYEDYVEWCEDNEIEPSEEGSEQYWNWAYDESNQSWEDLECNIAYSKYANYPCLVIGELGLWDGHHEIIPVLCDDLLKALHKTCYANYDHNVEVLVKKDSTIHVVQSHHDGTNHFDIIILTRKGEDKWNSLYERDKEDEFDVWNDEYRRKFEYLF